MLSKKARDAAYYAKNRITIIASVRAYYEANKVQVLAAQSKYAAANRPRQNECNARYRAAHPVEAAASSARYKSANLDKGASTQAKYRAAQKQAVPAWADSEGIKLFYWLARQMNRVIDHIVPLQHPLVCGLHVVDNLQMLTGIENSRKGNKFDVN